MGIRDPLKRLDQRVLPPIANVFARLGRGARRLKIIRFVAVLISVTVVLVAVYAAGRRPAPTYSPPGSTVQLGVSEGGSIPTYVASSKAKLTSLIAGSSAAATAPPAYFALVSMSKYLDPTQLATVLVGLDLQVTYVIMRVPSPYQTEIFQVYTPGIPQDLIRAMLANADKKQREAADDVTLEAQAGTATATDRTLRAQYKQGAMVATLEETSYRSASTCHCVYGAVVHATPSVLGALATRRDVRVVQPAPLHLTPDLAVFLPPLPDQLNLAGPPPSSAPQSP
jgi:hypothetical protein